MVGRGSGGVNLSRGTRNWGYSILESTRFEALKASADFAENTEASNEYVDHLAANSCWFMKHSA